MQTAKKLYAYLPFIYSLIISLILLRIYEIHSVTTSHYLSLEADVYLLKSMVTDFTFAGFSGVILLFVSYILLHIRESMIRPVLFFLSALFLLSYTALIQYFIELLLPLGADLYAYSIKETSNTIHTSVNIGINILWPYFLVICVYFSAWYFLVKRKHNDRISRIALISILILAILFPFTYPDQTDFKDQNNYNLISNKSVFFAADSYRYFNQHQSFEPYSGEEYPLFRESDLGKNPFAGYIEPGKRPPNLVFIILESFGGSFMEPNATYGGFTPYLDSLANESLYWTHFLSTSGRSFGLLPSLFGSLPVGEKGFLEMGPLAPDHQSLIRILGDNNYRTTYFCGYDGSFDNVNIFLEQQNIDLIVDANRFNNNYTKMEEIGAGFTWGYEDKQTFQRAFDFLDPLDSDIPRLDIFFTLNLHEPFIISDQQKYLQRVREISQSPDFDSSKKKVVETYEKIFAAILYTDDAVNELISRYKKRDDFEDTIFIITGDHRLAPIPHKNLIDRFYVPFMIYSPKVKQPVEFHSVSSHNEVTPSLLAFLHNQYNLNVPEKSHWIGNQIDMKRSFASSQNIALMRNKNQLAEYLSNDLFLSESRLFHLKEGMLLEEVFDRSLFSETNEKFAEYKQINQYVTTENKLMPVADEQIAMREKIEADYRFLDNNQFRNLTSNELFIQAQKLAYRGDYEDARTILRVVLRERPGFYDARLLLGRTYGWDGQYDKAELHFREVIDRKPDYADSYAALADLSYWSGENQKALDLVNTGLEFKTDDSSLLYRKARALWILERIGEAVVTLEKLLSINPEHEKALKLKQRLQVN